MELATADLLLRTAAFALSMAGAAAIVLRAPGSVPARYAAVVVGGIGAFMVASAPGAHRALGLGAFLFNAWCLATPAFVWLLALRLFRDEPAPSPWLHGVPVALVSLTMLGDYGRFRLGLIADYPQLSHAILLAGRAASMVLLLFACWLAVSSWRADLVESRRRIRAIFVAVFGAVFLAAAGSEFVIGGAPTPLGSLVFAHALLVALAFAVVLAVASRGVPELIDRPASSREAMKLVRAPALESALAERIVAETVQRELWKRERLGIGDLAMALGVQEYRVRRAINGVLGYRNFNEFLHDHRLRATAARLADPAQAHLPVLTIALDCGYGSIGPFNRAFKARFGVTPTQYRNLRSSDSADSEIGQASS
jgi:AraC-like DNA-binding protein